MSSLATGAIVEVGTLLKVVLYSLAFALGVAVVFAAGVSSTTGLLDALRARRTLAATGWGVLAAVSIACVLAAVVLGIVVMTQK